MLPLRPVAIMHGLLAAAIACLDLSGLQQQLSDGATITGPRSATDPPLRWSQFHEPTPGAIVSVATEGDVAVTVQYCAKHNIPFLAQNGGNGWSETINLDSNGIIINLAKLNFVTLASDKKSAQIGGGALVSDVINVASANSVLIATGTCNCVGALGAGLGGGLGYLQGQYSLTLDNIQSMNVVLASGQAQTVTPQDKGLWFALRGAGPNFGIVTSAVLNAYPVNAAGLQAWTGPLIFTPAQLPAVISAIDQLNFQPQMALDMLYVMQGGQASIIVGLFYHGTEADGKTAFSSLYAVGPVADLTAITPYTKWNSASDTACVKGGRKPSFGAGLARMDPSTWQQVYNVWYSYVTQNPDASHTTVLMNAYPTGKQQQFLEYSSAYPWRRAIKFFAVFNNLYTTSALDSQALATGDQVRSLWRASSGIGYNATYINNAFGDESNSVIYGQSLAYLRQLKRVYDANGRFNNWFSIDT